MKIINGEARYKLSEAKQHIATLANRQGAKINHNGLGCRRDGVPGTGGGTFTVSMYCKYPRSMRSYVEIDFC